jgi:hypothetical protein
MPETIARAATNMTAWPPLIASFTVILGISDRRNRANDNQFREENDATNVRNREGTPSAGSI